MADAFRFQARGCARMGSELYSRLLERCAQDIEANGPVARVIEGWQGHPVLDALPLRVAGAVHRIVLAGRAPELARFFPTAGGQPGWPELGEVFLRTLEAHAEEIRPELAHQVQTNEVRRCAALLGGFLTVAKRTALPLDLLEIGSSAGLNLHWDRYRYALGPHRWGDPDAALRIQADWHGPPPPLDAHARVLSRRGCDIAPLDVADPEQLRRLESFVWPDQPDRLERLRAAARVARLEPAPIDQLAARDFLPKALERLPDERSTVLFQSVVYWYLSEEERGAIERIVAEAGARASASSPLAWLRMEGSNLEHAELRLRSWPGCEDQLIAHTHWHSQHVSWIGASHGRR